MIQFLLAAILLLSSTAISGEEADNMRAFPAAEKGMIREHLINDGFLWECVELYCPGSA